MRESMHDWYERAGVRTQERRLLADDLDAGLVLFPERQIPHLHHEGLRDLEPAARAGLVARHLYQYLQFTVHLETEVVNRGVVLVANDAVDLCVPRATRLDALRIYCDEGFHALSSLDLVHQVEAATGEAAPAYDFGPRARRVARTAHRFLPQQPTLAHLLQVVVFETVVTSILLEVPRDVTVQPTIRAAIADHARDEARHHAFFVAFFRELWTHLPGSLRRAVAPSLPHVVDDCLRPDLAPVRASLRAAGVPPDVVEEVVRDAYGEERVRASVRAASRHTVRLFESTGVLDVPGAAEEFAAVGLLPGVDAGT